MEVDEFQSLEAISEILAKIDADPYELPLYAEYLQLALSSGVDDYIDAARQTLTKFWPAGDDIWLPLVEAQIQQGIDSLEGTLSVLELFETAEEDYLSIPLLQKHIEFLIDRHAYFSSLDDEPEEGDDVFSPEWTRMVLESVVQKGVSHLTRGHLLWKAHFDWEMEQLEDPQLQGEERTNLIVGVEAMILERLKQPHSTHEETFQLYSTFTTKFKPANIYEKLLVEASKLKAPAVKAYERREQFEQFLEQSDHSPEAYSYYLSYERRARRIDIPVISTLYERAISDTAKRRFVGVENAELALRAFWTGYCDVLRMSDENVDHQRAVLQRATRSVPGSGATWARYIRFLEGTEDDVISLMQSVSDIYGKAFSTGLLQKSVEEIVPVVLARAGLIKRVTSLEGDDSANTLFKILEEGIELVRKVSRQGDPRFRLEKFLSELYTDLADSPDLASVVWEAAAKYSKATYLPWMKYIESLTRQQKYDEARAVFKDVVNRRLDWPEAIFDAWIEFEHLHGTVKDIYHCLDQVEDAQNKVNTRRAKEAEKAALQQASTQASASSLINDAVQQASEEVNASSSTAVMDTDNADASRKRKPDDSGDRFEGNKKIKIAVPTLPKRDRENCTVFVADLPIDVSKGDLTALFKDCGRIREVKVSTVEDSRVATVEFQDRESVPAALTKDKKRLDGKEIAVHVAWKSTLYVTNFPEKADDAYIRELFRQFGLLFDVRWPSKKFKASRRFCYVQFTTTEAAQVALSLHGKELEPGLKMNVFISDPERKKERSDASADAREIYVAGLSKFVTEKDLERLFNTYGPVKDIRMIKDDGGLCKGVAFVEFDDELSAQRALQANNHDMKNRRIAVTLSDSRVRARHKTHQTASGLTRRSEALGRSVRIKGLPPATQEGLLQQALEKIVPVKRLEVFQDSGEAIAELESTAGAGKLLLMKEPLKFGESVLQISEEITGTASKAPQPKAGGSMFIPRNAASRPRAGLGSSKKPVQKSSNTVEDTGQERTSKAGMSQNDFRKLLG